MIPGGFPGRGVSFDRGGPGGPVFDFRGFSGKGRFVRQGWRERGPGAPGQGPRGAPGPAPAELGGPVFDFRGFSGKGRFVRQGWRGAGRGPSTGGRAGTPAAEVRSEFGALPRRQAPCLGSWFQTNYSCAAMNSRDAGTNVNLVLELSTSTNFRPYISRWRGGLLMVR